NKVRKIANRLEHGVAKDRVERRLGKRQPSPVGGAKKVLPSLYGSIAAGRCPAVLCEIDSDDCSAGNASARPIGVFPVPQRRARTSMSGSSGRRKKLAYKLALRPSFSRSISLLCRGPCATTPLITANASISCSNLALCRAFLSGWLLLPPVVENVGPLP